MKKTLSTFSPLLRPGNRYATLITLFLNACKEAENDNDVQKTTRQNMIRVQQFIPGLVADIRSGNPYGAEFVKSMSAQNMFMDFDGLFARYMKLLDFSGAAKSSGVMMKADNTIIPTWPYRLSAEPTKAEFDLLLASGLIGHEKYVEWCRA